MGVSDSRHLKAGAGAPLLSRFPCFPDSGHFPPFPPFPHFQLCTFAQAHLPVPTSLLSWGCRWSEKVFSLVFSRFSTFWPISPAFSLRWGLKSMNLLWGALSLAARVGLVGDGGGITDRPPRPPKPNQLNPPMPWKNATMLMGKREKTQGHRIQSVRFQHE